MASVLYRLGRLAFRRRWYVLVMWLLVLGALGGGAARAPAAPSDTLSVPGTESQQANDLLQASFPGTSPGGAVAQLVFVAPHGQQVTAAKYETEINKVVAGAAATPQVASAVTPFQSHEVSKNGSVAVATISYKVPAGSLTAPTTGALQAAVQQGQTSGLTVEVGGNALSTPASDGGMITSLAIAALVLLLTFGSLVAAGLPLLTAAIGVGASVAGITALGSALGLSGTTRTLALMLGLAVGIDYALFIVSRYREERARGLAASEAAATAAGTAGSAVVFAGLTVIMALAGLSVVGIPLLTKMGLSAAAAVAVAVLVAVTLIPSLLGFFPRAVMPGAALLKRPSPRLRMPRIRESGGPNLGSRWATFVLKRPLAVLLLSAAALGAIAVPAMRMHLGAAGNAALPTSDTERRAYDDISMAFGPGYNGPLTIVVNTGKTADAAEAANQVAAKIGDTPGVAAVSRPQFDSAGTVAKFTAIPVSSPDSQQTADLVSTIRAERAAVDSGSGARYLVTGLTAVNIDTAQKISSALLPYLAAVVGLAFLLLMVVFRSLLVPLKATFGFVLSLAAALGALVAVFQWGWLDGLLGIAASGPIMPEMPIFMIGIAFGLAMDYEFFLVSRIREARASGQTARQAVVSGFGHSARVVTAAAAIMIAVFAGFISNSETLVQMIGFGMAAAVLLDAFVVRLTIVPAVLGLLGRRAWWLPSWLDKLLPHVDIEGEALTSAPVPGPGIPPEAAAAGPGAATATRAAIAGQAGPAARDQTLPGGR